VTRKRAAFIEQMPGGNSHDEAPSVIQQLADPKTAAGHLTSLPQGTAWRDRAQALRNKARTDAPSARLGARSRGERREGAARLKYSVK
jgi:hypothetical protein